MNLRERAIAAFRKEQEHEVETEAKLFAKRVLATEAAFEKRFGTYHVVTPGTCDIVHTDDGLELQTAFSVEWSSNVSHFRLRGACPDCGAECYSREILTLTHLGEQIECFEPGWDHHCLTTPEYPTVGDRLLEALQDFIGELDG